jgi:hypothetical protein
VGLKPHPIWILSIGGVQPNRWGLIPRIDTQITHNFELYLTDEKYINILDRIYQQCHITVGSIILLMIFADNTRDAP